MASWSQLGLVCCALFHENSGPETSEALSLSLSGVPLDRVRQMCVI